MDAAYFTFFERFSNRYGPFTTSITTFENLARVFDLGKIKSIPRNAQEEVMLGFHSKFLLLVSV